jgi:pyruvate/2-oxoglutarate dehydrogenase complex dihydrolipoamide acyltransferase (E2) component
VATSVYLPSIGMGISEATIVKWLKGVGDRVEAGEVVAEVESAKSVAEIEAPVSGTLSQVHFPVNTEVEIGTEVATIEE